jgi:hypothetical protein
MYRYQNNTLLNDNMLAPGHKKTCRLAGLSVRSTKKKLTS